MTAFKLGMSLLYVDDQEDAIHDFSDHMSDQLHLVTASNFDAGWQLFSQDIHPEIAVVVASENIVNADNKHFLREVKQKSPHVICILLSSYVDADEQVKTIEGMEDLFAILTKPIDLEHFQHGLLQGLRQYKEALFNHQLEEVSQELIKANQFKNQILFNLTHEFQTPIACIIHATESLLHSSLIPQQEEDAKMVLTSARLLQNIVADVFDYSRMEANEISIIESEFVLIEVLQEIQHMHQFLIEEKQITYQVSTSENLPQHLSGDVTHLKQVLINLIHNAIKFTPTKGIIELDVRQQTSEPSKDLITLQFTVKDTGIGISEAQLERLFQPFSKVASDGNTGTGLGLSISYQIVKHLGGELTVTSQLKQGATFHFTLPFQIIESTPSGKKKTIAATQPVAQFHRHLQILLVENDTIHQKIMRRDFESMNCDLDCIEDGLDVLPAVKEKSYDVILMDCLIPNLSGLDVCQQIRHLEQQDKQRKRIPIIALTAYPLDYKQICLEAGMDDFMMKPHRMSQLVETIEYWLQKSGDKQSRI